MPKIFSPEQREAWYANTQRSPFNVWLDAQVRGPDGRLDLEQLHAVALRYGVDRRSAYAALNPGQQRMNIGNLLRARVPASEYEGSAAGASRVASAPSPARTLSSAPGGGARPPAPKITAPADEPVSAPAPASGAPSLERRLIRASSVRDLLAMHGAIMDELRERKVVRTANGPGGDYAELLFARAFGWELAGNSAASFDATDGEGTRYQIKSLRLATPNSSRQLSALRRLEAGGFDYLAAVLFAPDYAVQRAVILPHGHIQPRARFAKHTNAWIFHLTDDVWSLPGARDVTAALALASQNL